MLNETDSIPTKSFKCDIKFEESIYIINIVLNSNEKHQIHVVLSHNLIDCYQYELQACGQLPFIYVIKH